MMGRDESVPGSVAGGGDCRTARLVLVLTHPTVTSQSRPTGRRPSPTL